MWSLPAGGDALEEQRRELALDLVVEGEIEPDRLAGLAVAQDGLGLARIVVAVVAEEDDLAADLGLEPPGRLDLGDEEAPREKPAGLLAEADDRAAVMGWLAPPRRRAGAERGLEDQAEQPRRPRSR